MVSSNPVIKQYERKRMANSTIIDMLAAQLQALGLHYGDIVMVHSSFRALGVDDPEQIIQALLLVLGDTGTLLTPALSYNQKPALVHDSRTTPCCVGFLAEYMRQRPGTRRSIHPTHSVCGIGSQCDELLDRHFHDRTPCGPESPFHKLFLLGGKILMLGCGLRPNTAMHAVEEYAIPPYLFGTQVTYQITDLTGHSYEAVYTPHNFAGVRQRYDRVEQLLPTQALTPGMVGKAQSYLIDAPMLLQVALAELRKNPIFFVEHDIA